MLAMLIPKTCLVRWITAKIGNQMMIAAAIKRKHHPLFNLLLNKKVQVQLTKVLHKKCLLRSKQRRKWLNKPRQKWLNKLRQMVQRKKLHQKKLQRLHQRKLQRVQPMLLPLLVAMQLKVLTQILRIEDMVACQCRRMENMDSMSMNGLRAIHVIEMK